MMRNILTYLLLAWCLGTSTEVSDAAPIVEQPREECRAGQWQAEPDASSQRTKELLESPTAALPTAWVERVVRSITPASATRVYLFLSQTTAARATRVLLTGQLHYYLRYAATISLSLPRESISYPFVVFW